MEGRGDEERGREESSKRRWMIREEEGNAKRN